jgi:hypothetical protein
LESLKPEASWQFPLSSCYWIRRAFSTPPLLIIDEFDMVGAAPPIALNTLLHGLRAMLRGHTSSPAVAAIIVAGPPSILDIRTTVDGSGKRAGSPWNVTYASTPRRFDVTDLRVLFDEWATGEGVSPVDDAVLEGVIALTQGHRGWSMLLAKELVGMKPLPSFTAGWWTEQDPASLEESLSATDIVKTFKADLTSLGTANALLASTVLSTVQQRQAAGGPVRRGEAVVDDWAPVLGLLTDVGAVVYDDDVRRLLIGPAVYDRAVGDVLRRLLSCDTTSPRNVHEMRTQALLTSVVRVQQAVVASAGPLSSMNSTILRLAKVPSEASYRSAMAYVLRTWLGNLTVVEESNLGGGAKRVDLRVEAGTRKITIEIVCHRPAGSPDIGQSVAEHLVRVIEDYRPAHPEFEPWLVNFVTQEEEAVAGPAIRACMADPAFQACNRMHVVVDGAEVLQVTVWLAGSVEPE